LRHVILDAQRRQYRVKVVRHERPISSPEPGEALLADEEAAAVRRAFSKLSAKDQELLELRVVAGLNSDDVAALLGRRPGAVRMAQARALERLRHLVEER
jgi:RNA polymerase sigma-70 factor (ECF subfamily)